jgi:hypothetical protein
MSCFIILLLTRYNYYMDSQMCGVCDMHGGGEKYMQGFGKKT